MKFNTTQIPVDHAGEILRNHYLNNSKDFVSVVYPFRLLPQWASKRIEKLLNLDEPYFGIVSNEMVVIQQNDGDTLLVIWDKEGVLYWNPDAKKSHGWQREN